MTRDEHETTTTWDYGAGVVRIYTTRASVYNGFCHRLGEENVTLVRQGAQDWSFTVPLEQCRGPEKMAKILNPDAKKPWTQKAS